jgi:hypothetical protein
MAGPTVATKPRYFETSGGDNRSGAHKNMGFFQGMR